MDVNIWSQCPVFLVELICFYINWRSTSYKLIHTLSDFTTNHSYQTYTIHIYYITNTVPRDLRNPSSAREVTKPGNNGPDGETSFPLLHLSRMKVLLTLTLLLQYIIETPQQKFKYNSHEYMPTSSCPWMSMWISRSKGFVSYNMRKWREVLLS